MTQITRQTAIASAAGRVRLVPLPAAILLALGLAPAGARAATIVVTDAGDTDVAAANTCTLRQAILSMNNSSISGDCANSGGAFGGNDTIHFAPGIGTVELADLPDNVLHVTDPDLTIDAGDGRTVAIRRPAGATNKFGLLFADQGNGGSLSLVGLELSNGAGAHARPLGKYGVNSLGGAVYASNDLGLRRCVVADNSAFAGGGVMAKGGLSMTDSRVSGNLSQSFYAAVTATSAVVRNSSITGNTITSGVNVGPSAGRFGDLTMSETTVSGNTSKGFLTNPTAAFPTIMVKTAKIDHSTIACNLGVAGILIDAGGALTLESSIVSNTQGDACAAFSAFDIIGPGGPDPLSIDGSNNLVGKILNATSANAPSNADPLLLPLANNHGGTLTHALAQGSPAIDAGGAATESYDQRGTGFPRVVGTAADIGAFEYGTPFSDGSCGSVNGAAPVSLAASTPGLCAVGSPLQLSGAGPWDWQCGDARGGARATCHAGITVTPTLAWNKPFYTGAGSSPAVDLHGIYIGAYVWGEPARLQFSVNGSAPRGTVDFYLGTVQGAGSTLVFTRDRLQCAGVALVAGKAECSVDTTSIYGRFYYQAVFTSSDGDYAFDGAQAPVVNMFINAASVGSTTAIVSADPGTTVVGQPFTVSAQVTAAGPSTGTPAGAITISDVTDNASCTAAAGGSPGSCMLVAATAGTKTLHASFGGMSWPAPSTYVALRGSQSADVAWIVNPAATTTTLASAGPVALGASTMLAATLNVVAPGAGTPTGTITITDTTDALSCSYAADAPTPGCSIQPPSAGSKTLTASYAGDGNFLPSASEAGALVVNPVASGLALASSANPASYGQTVTLTATVTSPQGSPAPVGSVSFTDGATLLCANVALTGTAATCATSTLATGTHTLTANYSGDANHAPASFAITQTIAAPAVPAPLSRTLLAVLAALVTAIGVLAMRWRGARSS